MHNLFDTSPHISQADHDCEEKNDSNSGEDSDHDCDEEMHDLFDTPPHTSQVDRDREEEHDHDHEEEHGASMMTMIMFGLLLWGADRQFPAQSNFDSEPALTLPVARAGDEQEPQVYGRHGFAPYRTRHKRSRRELTVKAMKRVTANTLNLMVGALRIKVQSALIQVKDGGLALIPTAQTQPDSVERQMKLDFPSDHRDKKESFNELQELIKQVLCPKQPEYDETHDEDEDKEHEDERDDLWTY
ncbi:hypothetical protein N7540_004552 [Penicillium herquei]|nr:hypothetical protein N7540_004552 [Penicillium herquei]